MVAPVLLVFFNRPDTLAPVFEQIRRARPERLYLAQDGARPGNEDDSIGILKCREIVDAIDWPCEVHKRYLKENVGCGQGPFQAISWAFEKEDRLIILEDDCIASQSFFSFCDEMLSRYYDDDRIFMVTGCNLLLKAENVDSSYFFGYSGTNCGWATWKRNWDRMDYSCSFAVLPEASLLNEFLIKLSGKKGDSEFNSFVATASLVSRNKSLSYWDVQWQAVRYLYHQISIIPSVNLITNIGLGPTSTHAKKSLIPDGLYSNPGEFHTCYNERYEMEFPLKHPQFIIQNVRYDAAIDKALTNSLFKRIAHGILNKILLIRKCGSNV